MQLYRTIHPSPSFFFFFFFLLFFIFNGWDSKLFFGTLNLNHPHQLHQSIAYDLNPTNLDSNSLIPKQIILMYFQKSLENDIFSLIFINLWCNLPIKFIIRSIINMRGWNTIPPYLISVWEFSNPRYLLLSALHICANLNWQKGINSLECSLSHPFHFYLQYF